MDFKIYSLITEREKALNIHVVEKIKDKEGNFHLLCERESDGSYVVWTAYNTGEEKTSFESFYNGAYDLSLKAGIDELCRRVKKGGIKYNGFKKIKCNHCDEEVMLENSLTNTCDGCGTDYNNFGQELAPREQWGWETGENLSDIMNGAFEDY